jgi:hypothetical protein
MFARHKTGARAALLAAAAFTFSLAFAPHALADRSAKTSAAAAREALRNVPVFFIAGADGQPIHADGDRAIAYYLTRTQASIAVGLARADRAAAGDDADDLHVAASTLDAAAHQTLPHRFVRPASHIDEAAAVPGVPLFLIRDKAGAPFTVKDEAGQRRVFFYLSDDDAQAFAQRILTETKRNPEDVRISIVSLDPVLNAILTSTDPLVQDWTIWSSAETRMDADSLKTAAQAQLAQPRRPE